jgi:glycosyltransferase involved in cell wall biosynthesis
MTNNQPLVSVIIPVYNGENYLAEAIESALAQTYQPLEILVINDGSTDNTEEIAKSFLPSIRYYFQAKSGQGEALNKGIKLAKGDFFAFLDHDDLWLQDKLTKQIEAFNYNQELELVFGLVQQFYSPELDDNFKAKIKCNTELMSGHIPSAMIIKRDSFFRVGFFETHLQLVSFPSWYSRALELGLNTFTLPELVTKRRLHQHNTGIRNRDHKKEYISILKASLDRKRATQK